MPLIPLGRVIIIDDNEDLADLFGALIEALGFEVKVAYSGFLGIPLIEQFAPQVIFCDIGMPGMNGCEVAEHVRQLALQPRPLLIAVTAWSDEARVKQMLSAGYDLQLTKPVEYSMITTLLHGHFKVAM